MTILISDMGDTVIKRFKNSTNLLADFTVLPKYGVWRNFLNNHPWINKHVQGWYDRRTMKKRLETGFQVGEEAEVGNIPTLEQLATEPEELNTHELARSLARKIKLVAMDCKANQDKKYSYEEWVEITRIIRFSAGNDRLKAEEEEEGLIEWDWIGENSPMMAEQTEPEFVLDRLCESMLRYVKNQEHLDGLDKRKGRRRTSNTEARRKSLEIRRLDSDPMDKMIGRTEQMEFTPPSLYGAVIRRGSRRGSDGENDRL